MFKSRYCRYKRVLGATMLRNLCGPRCGMLAQCCSAMLVQCCSAVLTHCSRTCVCRWSITLGILTEATIPESIAESRLYWESWLYRWHGGRILDDTETRNHCFDHVNVLYLMSNHAQTILHEIPLLEEPRDTPKRKFTVQKTTLFKNNSTFFIIKMKHFSIDHNTSSVDSCRIVFFQKRHDDIISVSFLKTWKCPKSKTHGEFQLNGFQLWPPLTNPDNFCQKMSDFESHVQSWTPPEIGRISLEKSHMSQNIFDHNFKGNTFFVKSST